MSTSRLIEVEEDRFHELPLELNRVVAEVFACFPTLQVYFLLEDVQEHVAIEKTKRKLPFVNKTHENWWVRKVTKNYCLSLKKKLEGIKKNEAEAVTIQNLDIAPAIQLSDWDLVFDNTEDYALFLNLVEKLSPAQLRLIIQSVCKDEEMVILYLRYSGRPQRKLQEDTIRPEGLSFKEIAAELNMPDSTVRSHARRGLKKLFDEFRKNKKLYQ